MIRFQCWRLVNPSKNNGCGLEVGGATVLFDRGGSEYCARFARCVLFIHLTTYFATGWRPVEATDRRLTLLVDNCLVDFVDIDFDLPSYFIRMVPHILTGIETEYEYILSI